MKKIKIIGLSLTFLVFSLNSQAAFNLNGKTASNNSQVINCNSNTFALTNLEEAKQLNSEVSVLQTKSVLAKSDGDNIDKTLYIILSIIGLGWIGMGLNDKWKGSDWIVSLILSLLLWLPGLIYSLVKMKKYYN
jgi:uncharacterized membrane protein YqaE (UPF0057 family)